MTGGMTLDLRYQTYTDAIPATYLYHSRPAPSEPHHPAPLRIANLACLSAQSCLLYGKGRGYAVSQTKLAILHSSTTLHKVALSAIAVAYQQRYESTGNTGTPLTTVRSPSTSSGFTVQYNAMVSGLGYPLPCPFSLCSATVDNGTQQMHHWLSMQLLRATAIPATAFSKKRAVYGRLG